jgi:hypothetical protein
MRLQANGQVGKHGMAHKDFNGLGFSRDAFKRVIEALSAAGLLDTLGGYRWFSGGWEGSIMPAGSVRGSTVSSFRLTGDALELAASAGVRPVTLKDWLEHWERPRASLPQSAPLVELRGRRDRVGNRKSDSRPLAVDHRDPWVAKLAGELAEHNAFVAAKGVEGVLFSGLKRVFNNGDVPGFAWQWGGRFASLPGGGYEREGKSDRLAVMLLGSEAVAEIDLRASHLTIAYGLSGESFDPVSTDPYAVGHLDRELVKRWITQAIGRGAVDAGRWSDEAKAYYASLQPNRSLALDVPFKAAREAIILAHPILAELENRPELAIHSLLFHESEILMRAMKMLRKIDLPSLPVHDCLIVPNGAKAAAQEALRAAFSDHIEQVTGKPSVVVPAMTVETASRPAS